MPSFHPIASVTKWAEGEQITRTVLLRYIFSGGTGAALNLGLLYILTDLAKIYYLISATLSFLLAVMAGFLLQKHLTFHDGVAGGKKISNQFLRFGLVALLNTALNAALMFTLVDIFGLWYMFSQVLCSGAIAVLSLFLYRRFIFLAQSKHFEPERDGTKK